MPKKLIRQKKAVPVSAEVVTETVDLLQPAVLKEIAKSQLALADLENWPAARLISEIKTYAKRATGFRDSAVQSSEP